jgi:uncharacterized protein YqeY
LTELEIDGLIKKSIKVLEEQAELAEKADRSSIEFVIQSEYLKTLLPTQLTELEIRVSVRNAIVETKSESIKDMGKVMGYLKDAFGSALDMKVASKMVREELK